MTGLPSLRLSVQHRPRKNFGKMLTLRAQLVSMTQNGLDIQVAHMGFGKHISAIPPEQQTKFYYWLWVNIMIWGASIAVPKYSVIFMYARVFHVNNMAIRISLWVGGILTTCFLIYNMFSDAFQCTPVRKAWLGPLVEGHCIDAYAWYMSINLFDFLIDIYLLVLPLPILWSVQMAFKRKLYIMLVFLAGYRRVQISRAIEKGALMLTLSQRNRGHNWPTGHLGSNREEL